jgi:hypothetical protein
MLYLCGMKKLLYIIGLILFFAAGTAAKNACFLDERVEVAANGGVFRQGYV